MRAIAAGVAWVGRPRTGQAASRGAIAAVRGRRSERERQLARRVGLGALAAFAIALVLVWIRLQILHTGYDLSTARKLEIKLEQERGELRLAIATLTSPRRLEEAARARLGMGPPAPGQVVSAP